MTEHDTALPPTLDAAFDRCLRLAVDVLIDRSKHFEQVLNAALQAAQQNLPLTHRRAHAGHDGFGRVFAQQFRTQASAELAKLLADEYARDRQHPPSVASPPRRTLNLLSVEETERFALKSSLAHQLGAETEVELKLLNRNLAALLGLEEIGAAQSPFGPATVVEAAMAALHAHGHEAAVVNALVRALARELAAPLLLSYQLINTYFGEEPPLQRPRNRVEGPAIQTPAAPAATAPGTAFEPVPLAEPPPPYAPPPYAPQPLAAPPPQFAPSAVPEPARAPQTAPAGRAAHTGHDAPPGGVPAPQSPYPAYPAYPSYPPSPPAGDPYVIDLLVRLLALGWRAQAAAATAASGAPLVVASEGAALTALAGTPRPAAAATNDDADAAADAAGLNGSLAGLSSLSHGHPSEEFADELKMFESWRAGIRDLLNDVPRRVAFDLVTSVFDPVVQCDLVSSEFRRRTLSVQTDLLQFALRNPSAYFLCHRTVLNAIESLAISAAGTRDPQGVLAACWDEALAVLPQFVEQPAERKQAVQDAVQKTEQNAAATPQVERTPRATATRQAMAWMRRVVPRNAKASFMREFLLWTWSRVLVQALLDPKLTEVLTPRYLRAARTAGWSVQKLHSDEQRNRLRRAIPGLFSVLKEGVRAVRLDEKAEVGFFARLVEAHRRSLGLEVEAPIADGRAAAPPPPPAVPTGAAGLREGEFYLLRSPSGTLKLQLKSRSADGDSLLFVCDDGRRPLMLSAESVSLTLRDGTLRRYEPAADQAVPPESQELGQRFEKLRALIARRGR